MPDKRTTVDDIVSELRSGMTIGIGGWGSRRKPMAVIRAICRSDLTDLTVVAYGGPDVGLLCATGKVAKVVCGFVTLDSIALDPHWRAARQHGTVEAMEVDEGMFFLGAADRRFMTTESIVENGALADEGHPLSTVPIHRMLVDGVAASPGGAHFTANPPDYGRDEKFQKEYAAAATDPAEWEAFANRYVFVEDDEYRAHVAERQA